MLKALKTIFDSLIGIEANTSPVGISQIREMSNQDLLDTVLNQPVQTGKVRPLHIKPTTGGIQSQPNPFGQAVFSPFKR